MQTSIDMARIAAEDGIKIIVVTPHIKNILCSTVKLHALVSQLNIYLKNQNIPVKGAIGRRCFCTGQFLAYERLYY
jgi:tyrosine-protein phosphatase YwqE